MLEIQTERDNLLCVYTDDNNRWFDKYPNLRKSIDKLEDINKRDRDEIIRGLKDIILKYDDELIDRHAVKFPMTSARRWYDQDLYSWLIINSIQYVDEDLIIDIILYLNEKL
jgi:hypothetical protein